MNRQAEIYRAPRGRVRIQCRRGQTGLGPNLADSLLDLSQSGARLTVRSELSAGEEIELILEGIGSTRPVRIRAEVVDAAPEAEGTYAIDVRFSHMIDYAEWQKLT